MLSIPLPLVGDLSQYPTITSKNQVECYDYIGCLRKVCVVVPPLFIDYPDGGWTHSDDPAVAGGRAGSMN